ncbi:MULTISPECIES: MFS transporter [Ralstonia]|uniref:MFS transporter n=1 Tax=Ralstonia TaxID=48736 RepID=UPI001E54D202|nr:MULTISPECIES: MFS transporter [Ralstonia]
MLVLSTSYWAVAVIGGALAVFSGFVLNAYYTYIPETMPTQLRALGNGIVMSGARVGGGASGVMGAALVTAGGLQYVTWTAAAIYIAFAIPVLTFGPRTTNRSLEAVADEQLGLRNGGEAPRLPHTRLPEISFTCPGCKDYSMLPVQENRVVSTLGGTYDVKVDQGRVEICHGAPCSQSTSMSARGSLSALAPRCMAVSVILLNAFSRVHGDTPRARCACSPCLPFHLALLCARVLFCCLLAPAVSDAG